MTRQRRLARLSAAIAALSVVMVTTTWPPAAFAGTQDPAAIRCAGVDLARQLNSDPDLNPDGTPVKITPDRRGKFVPVVMVHGWTGRSTHTDQRTGAFSHKIDLSTNQLATVQASRSFIGQLQRDPGAAVFTFDYHDYSARWIDDPHIGPALGDAIDCLFKATGEKVIIVAHSMGGLAARYALTHRGAMGIDRANEVSTVVTFGAPESGSLLALLGDSALNVGASTNSALAMLRLILAICGHATSTNLETGTPCDILPAPLRAVDSDAGRALRYGSAQLAALKPFPKNVTVDALAGDTIFTVPKAGWFHMPWDVDTVPIGDLVVMPDSATNGATLSTKASCSYQLSVSRGATNIIGLTLGLTAKNDVAQPITSVAGACYHGNLMRTIQLTNEATGIVNEDITARSLTTKIINVVPVDKSGNPAPGYTVVDDGGPVDCGSPSSDPSPASVGPNIVYCSPTAAEADICWPKPNQITILCGWYPWDKTLHQNTATAPITPVPAAHDPDPWALQLNDGAKCRLRNGGSWSGRSDNLVGAYSCDRGNEVVLVAQQNGTVIDKTSPEWTVQVGVLDDKQTGSPPPTTVHVLTAYFASSP
jgi:pimeloyl-ACP methyl ester carboxylesterase